MRHLDLRSLQAGDLVEYQLPVSKRPTQGAFQRWHTTEEGQLVLIVRSQQLGVDLPVDPQMVIRFAHPGAGTS
jgi:hypothetical protein